MPACGGDLHESNLRSGMPRPLRRDRIRSYNLFGESAELPDVLHCETIAARSALHDWELEPHRHGRLHQVLLLRKGTHGSARPRSRSSRRAW